MRLAAWLTLGAALAAAPAFAQADSVASRAVRDSAALAAPAPPPPPAFRQNVTWSPDGRMLAWSEYSVVAPDTAPTWNVWTATSAGTDRVRVVPGATWVDWSHDGKRLVWCAGRGGVEDVYSSRPDGGDERRLTSGAGAHRHPSWSPRGDRIAYVVKRDGAQELFVMNADGSNPRQLTADSADADAPEWSADGATLVWYARDAVGRDRLHVMSADGSSAAVVPTSDAGAIYPSFLPDGRLLYSAFTPAGRKLLTTVARDGTGQAIVAGIETFFARPTRDGKRIAFIAGAWPHSRVCIARADGVAARIVVGDPGVTIDNRPDRPVRRHRRR